MGERKMRQGVAQQIETPDLMLDRSLRAVVQGVEEFTHRLATGRIAVEDGLKTHLLDPESAVVVAVVVEGVLGGRLAVALGGRLVGVTALDDVLDAILALGDLLGDRGFLRVALLHALGEAFDCAGVEALLAEVLAADVDLGCLSGAGAGDVGALTVGLPAAGQDAGVLGREAEGLVGVDGVAEAEPENSLVLTSTSRGWCSRVLIVTRLSFSSRRVSRIVPVMPFSTRSWPGGWCWAVKMISSPALRLQGLPGSSIWWAPSCRPLGLGALGRSR